MILNNEYTKKSLYWYQTIAAILIALLPIRSNYAKYNMTSELRTLNAARIIIGF